MLDEAVLVTAVRGHCVEEYIPNTIYDHFLLNLLTNYAPIFLDYWTRRFEMVFEWGNRGWTMDRLGRECRI